MLQFARALTLTLATVLALAFAANCSSQTSVQLLHIKNLSPTADSLSRIKNPSPAQKKINQQLRWLDAKASESVAGCSGLDEHGDSMFFKRTVQITAHGPLFLGFEIYDGAACGGVHPYSSNFTLTYDLSTGALVKWSRYLTKANATDVTFIPVTESTSSLPAVRSEALEKLFVAGWKNNQSCRVEDVANPGPRSATDLTLFQLSPAPDGGGLSVLPVNLASAVSACAIPVILGKSGMDELGIPQDIQGGLLQR